MAHPHLLSSAIEWEEDRFDKTCGLLSMLVVAASLRMVLEICWSFP